MILKLVESLMKRNPCYTAGRKITVRGLMIHSVGCPHPDASAFINSWNSPLHKSSCVHAFIDGNSGTSYQTQPWNLRGWQQGKREQYPYRGGDVRAGLHPVHIRQ